MADLSRQSNGGWSNLGGAARKFHFFDSSEAGTIALCGKWSIRRAHELQPDGGSASPDDCAGCRRKVDARPCNCGHPRGDHGARSGLCGAAGCQCEGVPDA